ncbi:MAG: RipA family octameric membrane protein [Francisellaceae bacterium]
MSRFDNLSIENLWNDDNENFSNEQYNQMLIEQYKVYVELADRASFRRVSINLFFLIANIVIVGIMALGISRSSSELSLGLLVIPLLGLLSICYAWWRVVRFYRHTVNIKEQVIGALERRLPSSPIYSAERQAAEKKGSFTPLKRIETLMPFVFILLYLGIYIYLLSIWS